MNINSWRFLYLAGFVEFALRSRLALDGSLATLGLLLPLLLLPLRIPLRRDLQIAGLLLALGCSIALARSLSLEFWDTQRADLAWLCAGIGVGGLLTVRSSRPDSAMTAAEWLVVGLGWLVGTWQPGGPWLAMAPAALFTFFRQPAQPGMVRTGLPAAWLLFWIGMGLSRPWWDAGSIGALATAIWAAGVAVSYLPVISRLKLPRPLIAVALLPLLYPWLPAPVWALVFGLLCGWSLQHAAQPQRRVSSFALLLGLLLSFGLHSNLQWFGWLLWGAR